MKETAVSNQIVKRPPEVTVGTSLHGDLALKSAAASRRLLQGFGASALYPIVTAIVQVLTVPIFLRFWGPGLYGEWLVLITVPQYMALSDMGFGSVAGKHGMSRPMGHSLDPRGEESSTKSMQPPI